MDQLDLRAVVALCEAKHFGRAAETLGVSQPALSKRIQQLERQLGGALFERHARGATATRTGEFLAERARALLQETQQAEHTARRVAAGTSGFLRISAGMSILLSGLPEVLHQYRRAYPEVEVSVQDMSTHRQIEALRRGEIDIGFIRLGDDQQDLSVEPLIADELRIACPQDASPPRSRDWRTLFEHPLVTISRATSPTFHDHVMSTCRANGYEPASVQETDQLLAVLMLVQAGMGISLVPAALRNLNVPRVRIVPAMLEQARWTIGMAVNPGRRSAAAEKFAGIARKRLARL